MEFCSAPGRLYAEDANGVLLAEITFPTAGDGVANLNHTFVHPSLQGQGWRAGWCAPQQSSCALKAERPVFPAPTPLSGSGAIRSTAMCSSKTSRKKSSPMAAFFMQKHQTFASTPALSAAPFPASAPPGPIQNRAQRFPSIGTAARTIPLTRPASLRLR